MEQEPTKKPSELFEDIMELVHNATEQELSLMFQMSFNPGKPMGESFKFLFAMHLQKLNELQNELLNVQSAIVRLNQVTDKAEALADEIIKLRNLQ